MQIDEYDITSIHTGQKMLLTMDSYKGQIFEALVSKVIPVMNEWSKSFTIEAEFINPPGVLYPNLTCEANIVIRKKEKALTIPRNYLMPGDIQTANSQFETGSFVRTLISYAVGVTLLIVAGFGIYNILNMMIFEKMDTIAILKAVGFSGNDVKSIFLVIALSIGFFGGMFGLLLGLGLSMVIDQVPFTTASLPTIKTYPINYSLTFYFIGTVFSLVSTFFAGWFPSRKASQVDPVIIIRGK